jgi:serine/threonine-protein kinase
MSGAPRGTNAELKLPPDIQPGALLAGRYRIGRMLGSGGMGAVFAAEHVDLLEPVAIKVLLHDGSAEGSAEALGRFMREGWAASKIKSEYVARVNDLGRLEDGTPYIVMEYLDGNDLEALLRTSGPLEVELAVELTLQACEALAEAHALGIFHRDLKPSNLFCVQRSDGLLAVKLLDFGISKIARPSTDIDPRLTSTGATLGTPLYMSPEQMRSGRLADERSDIWSLGAIAYEILAGRVPFSAENLADLAVKIATETPTPLSEQRPQVPVALSQAIARCLDKESSRRFHSVAELARAIAPFGPTRALAHAERAERILKLTQTPKARITPMTRSTAITALGSHARLRGVSSHKNKGGAATRKVPKLALWLTGALIVGAAVLGALRWGMSLRQSAAQPTASETRANAAQAHEPATAAAPAAAVSSTQPEASTAPEAASSVADEPPARIVDALPKAAAPRAKPPVTSPKPTAPAKVSPPPKAAEPKPRLEATPITPPAAAPKAKSSELDSLGGRL